ncbi:EF-hand calcium-binding domain-containing protein 4B-like isoform X1 [Mixophyes fleayi]|uniref:EF-hand calcium-binding domain-containing protein 4B-like isoform X1 n=1 Tax=Mixophyes fleayi TaxID=3061075 RepID=UPI003F4DAD28
MERKRTKGRKMGSSRRLMQKQEDTEDIETETSPKSEEDTIFNEMAEKIQSLFLEGDTNSNIFITRDDMKKVSDIIFTTLEDLELLFDELNNEGKGYLTYEEFTSGLKSFINSGSSQWNQTRKRKSARRITEFPHISSLEEADTEERKQFKSFMEHLGAHNIFEDESEIWKLWTRLSHEEPHLLENLEEFLEKVTTQIKEAKKEKETLEIMLKKRISEHNEEVTHLYEEMEQQMSEEIKKLTNESHARNSIHNKEMKNVIDVKNKEVHQLVSVQNELERELHNLQSMEQVTKSENEMLKRTNQDLQLQLEKIRDQLSEAQDCLSDMKQKMIQHENKLDGSIGRRGGRAIARSYHSDGELCLTDGASRGFGFKRRNINPSTCVTRDICAKWETTDNEESVNISTAQFYQIFFQDPTQKERPNGCESELSPPQESAELVQQNITNNPNNFKTSRTRVISIEEDPISECLLKHHKILEEDIVEEMPNQELPSTQPLSQEGHCLALEAGDSFLSHPSGKSSHDDTKQQSSVLLQGKESPNQSTIQIKVSIDPKSLQHHSDLKDKTNQIAILHKQVDVNNVSIKESGGQTKLENLPLSGTTSYLQEIHGNPDYVYKIMFVGNSYVGKTAFLHRVHEGSYKRDMSATVGIDYRIKILTVDNKQYALQLWDTAGQERFYSITEQFFRKADGMVIMYDITSRETFTAVRHWLNCIQEKVMDDIVILLIGNKIDRDSERKVPFDDGKKLAQEHKLLFTECSAASGINIMESLSQIVRSLKENEDNMKKNVVKIRRSTSLKKTSCCM